MNINFYFRPNHDEKVWHKIAGWYALGDAIGIVSNLGHKVYLNHEGRVDLTIYWDALEYCALVKHPVSPHFVRLAGWSEVDPPNCYDRLTDADQVLCVSNSMESFVHRQWGDRTAYIPTSIDPTLMYPSDEIGQGWCFVGPMYNAKGVRTLAATNLEIDCYGEYESIPEGHGWLDTISVLGGLKIHGHVEHEKMGDVYRSHKYFIHLSHKEGGSCAVREAMACGLPAVVTRTGDNDLFVGGSGVLLPVNPPVSLILEAVEALEQADYNSLREQSISSVRQFCTEAVKELWRQALS